MAWPYHFVDLSDDQIYARRELLDRYGSYAQLSCLIPVALYQLYCLASWVLSERRRAKVDYTAVPSSLVLRKSKDSALSLVTRKWRIFQWWLGSEIYPGLGTNGDWILATLWTMWLIFLCTCQTGDGESSIEAALVINFPFILSSSHLNCLFDVKERVLRQSSIEKFMRRCVLPLTHF